jgi:cytochrome c biogenesis protein CcmG/thiol:disulfide interchange protein DsbE
MFKDKWNWMVLLIVLTLFGVGWLAFPWAPRTAAPRVGFIAPAFQTSTPSGEAIGSEQWRGKVVVLNFWATWCGPCRAEMPAFQSVLDARRKDGLIVIGLNQSEDADSITAFTRALQLQFPMGLDRDAAISELYGVHALPTTFLIDRRGVIRDLVIGGPMKSDMLESKLSALLVEP